MPTSTSTPAPLPPALTPSRERWLLLCLAGVQFTHIVDLMMMMPLGPVFTDLFGISDTQFAALVSAYSLSAGTSALLTSTVIDRFGRKRLLLTLYGLFGLAVLACGLAQGFPTLLAARVAAGAFGGVMTGLIHTIVADAVPFERRGRATGTVMAAFSLATVAGVPIGLLLAAEFDWRVPFFSVAGLSALLWLLAARSLPRLDAHVRARGERHSGLAQIAVVFGQPHLRRAFLFTAAMMSASFLVIPFITIYATANVGIPLAQLPLVYLCGGLATLFTAPLFGRLTDRHGKRRTYRWVALAAAVPLAAMTVLPPAPLWALLIVTTLFFVLVSGRMVPGMAILSSTAPPAVRGTFMTLNGSVQQGAMGLAAFVGGAVIARDADGRVLHFGWVGLLSVALSLAAVWLAARLYLPDDKESSVR